MRIGLSLASHHRVENPADGARFMIERAQAGAAAGLDFLTVGDQHATPEPYFQNVPILARMLAQWPSEPDRQIGCLFLLPLWHPVLVAEHVATLAAMHPGRFVLQTGIGHGADQFAAMGASMRTRGREITESIRIIDALFRGETVDSERYGLTDARISPTPAAPVEWWLGGHSDAALRRAAEHDADLYIGPGSPEAAAEIIGRFAHAIEAWESASEGPVRPLGERRIVARVNVLLASSADIEPTTAQFRDFGQAGATDIAVRQPPADQAVAVASISRLGKVRLLLSDGFSRES